MRALSNLAGPTIGEGAKLRRFAPLALALASTGAWSQDLGLPDCATNPEPPSIAVKVPGLLAQRLYIHRVHPALCASSGDSKCRPTAYVISGDELMSTASCAGWSFIAFGGKRKTDGWVASTRLASPSTENDASSPGNLSPPSNPSNVKSKNSACIEAETLMNEALAAGQYPLSALPTALEHMEQVANLPPGVGPGYQTWSGSVSDVKIQGKALKAVGFTAGGTCYDSFLQLWNSDFSTQIPAIPESAQDAGGGYTSQNLVILQKRPFFAQVGRAARSITLYEFDKDLHSSAICSLNQVPSKREIVKFAADRDVCNAVLSGKIDGAPIDDIEPFALTEDVLRWGRAPWMQMVARGSVDIDNDGQPDNIGIVVFDYASGAGCGHAYHAVLPIELNADGMPDASNAFNATIFKFLEKNSDLPSDTRLFSFHGVTYMERRTLQDADGIPDHDVWKFTSGGAAQVCRFVPIQYKAID